MAMDAVPFDKSTHWSFKTVSTMATDAVPLELLRSEFYELKLRFQAAADPRNPCKAWLIHSNDDSFLSSASNLVEGWKEARGCIVAVPVICPETRLMQVDGNGEAVEVEGRRTAGFKRAVKVEGSDVLKLLCDDAAALLRELPDETLKQLWCNLPPRTRVNREEAAFAGAAWVAAVFELAWQNHKVPPLRAEKWVPLDARQKIALESIRDFQSGPFKLSDAQLQSLGENPSWYSTLPDFTAASVKAISILQSWLNDVPKPAPEANGEPSKSGEQLRTDTPDGEQSLASAIVAAKQILRDWFESGRGEFVDHELASALPIAKYMKSVVSVLIDEQLIVGKESSRTPLFSDANLAPSLFVGTSSHWYRIRSTILDTKPVERQAETLAGGEGADGKQSKPKGTGHRRTSEELFKAALRTHHKYETGGSVLNVEPASTRQIESLTKNSVSDSTAGRLLTKHFGSVEKYRNACFSGAIGPKLVVLLGDGLHAFGSFDATERDVEDQNDNDSDD